MEEDDSAYTIGMIVTLEEGSSKEDHQCTHESDTSSLNLKEPLISLDTSMSVLDNRSIDLNNNGFVQLQQESMPVSEIGQSFTAEQGATISPKPFELKESYSSKHQKLEPLTTSSSEAVSCNMDSDSSSSNACSNLGVSDAPISSASPLPVSLPSPDTISDLVLLKDHMPIYHNCIKSDPLTLTSSYIHSTQMSNSSYVTNEGSLLKSALEDGVPEDLRNMQVLDLITHNFSEQAAQDIIWADFDIEGDLDGNFSRFDIYQPEQNLPGPSHGKTPKMSAMENFDRKKIEGLNIGESTRISTRIKNKGKKNIELELPSNMQHIFRLMVLASEYSGDPDGTLYCPYCSFSSAIKENFKDHLFVHGDEVDYKCPYCPYKSKSVPGMKVHFKVHRAEEAYKCSICDFTSKRKQLLSKHSKIQHPKSGKVFICDKCDYRCVTKKAFLNHKANKHFLPSENTNNQVEVHSEGVNQGMSNSHVHTNENDVSSTQEGDSSKTNIPSKIFYCPFCEFMSARKYNLGTHVKKCHNESQNELWKNISPQVLGKLPSRYSYECSTSQEESSIYTPTRSNLPIGVVICPTPKSSIDEDVYVCPYCEFTCSLGEVLKVHICNHSNNILKAFDSKGHHISKTDLQHALMKKAEFLDCDMNEMSNISNTLNSFQKNSSLDLQECPDELSLSMSSNENSILRTPNPNQEDSTDSDLTDLNKENPNEHCKEMILPIDEKEPLLIVDLKENEEVSLEHIDAPADDELIQNIPLEPADFVKMKVMDKHLINLERYKRIQEFFLEKSCLFQFDLSDSKWSDYRNINDLRKSSGLEKSTPISPFINSKIRPQTVVKKTLNKVIIKKRLNSYIKNITNAIKKLKEITFNEYCNETSEFFFDNKSLTNATETKRINPFTLPGYQIDSVEIPLFEDKDSANKFTFSKNPFGSLFSPAQKSVFKKFNHLRRIVNSKEDNKTAEVVCVNILQGSADIKCPHSPKRQTLQPSPMTKSTLNSKDNHEISDDNPQKLSFEDERPVDMAMREPSLREIRKRRFNNNSHFFLSVALSPEKKLKTFASQINTAKCSETDVANLNEIVPVSKYCGEKIDVAVGTDDFALYFEPIMPKVSSYERNTKKYKSSSLYRKTLAGTSEDINGQQNISEIKKDIQVEEDPLKVPDEKTDQKDQDTFPKEEAPPERMFPCLYCSRVFSKKCYLMRHMKKHSNCLTHPNAQKIVSNPKKQFDRNFQKRESKKCSENFCQRYCKEQETKELGLPKKEQGKYSCYKCDFSTTYKSSIISHFKTHTHKYLCSYCDFYCHYFKDMETHCHEVHELKESIKCPYCNFKAAKPKYLKNHIKEHYASMPFVCKQCDLRFETRSALEDHFKMRIHGAENFSKGTN